MLPDEVVEFLAPREGAVIVDCTLGGGGHSERLLERGACVLGIDRDDRALAAATHRLERFGARLTPLKGNFGQVGELVRGAGFPQVQGILADLGVSSPQLDDPQRGFSFSRPGPLDMRMGDDAQRLGEYLDSVSEVELTAAIRNLGEERFARSIARAILRQRPQDTAELAQVISSAIPRSQWPARIHPATRTFQALRMVINRELESLEALLGQIKGLLAVGGRAAVISFHSLEDRRVKESFRSLVGGCTCPRDLPICVCGGGGEFRALTKKAVVASESEADGNPRSRSARLRAVERMR